MPANGRVMSEGREKRLEAIRSDERFDVVVLGGGVNGVGVYRELALQGLRVLLVERNDFCSGCSAAPSRMIHGGLRYLENGEFDLVRESLEERDALPEEPFLEVLAASLGDLGAVLVEGVAGEGGDGLRGALTRRYHRSGRPPTVGPALVHALPL